MLHRYSYFISSVLTLCFAYTPAYALTNNEYLTELQSKAHQMQLAERPEWHKLLHYLPKLIAPGYKGLVDSPAFYLATNGKVNPQAELDATLASFFSDIVESKSTQNPQCAFIARYTWLNEQLKFDETRLPSQVCTRYQKWRATLNAQSLTLVFASAYLNSPSSMYGHPLLRVDAKDQNEQTRLLAYTVSFAANTSETNGLAFAMNGLFGGYAGTFSMLPYYAKVREYSDFENRDIWEYQLNFTPEEIDRILKHVWELDTQYYDYFFFDENCAYHLLGLLQVARPEFEFTKPFRWWIIPADAIREISSHPGLVARTVYRPSQATRIQHQVSSMTPQERGLVKSLSQASTKVADPTLSAMPLARTATVLETSLDYLSYQRATGKGGVPNSTQLTQELQNARSRLDIITPDSPATEPSTKPDDGHASSRVTLGSGRRNSQNYQELQARATYHDLLDQDLGYVRGAEIEFFSVSLRHYNDISRIDRIMPVSILSLVPRDEFFHSPSWKVSVGWQRVKSNKDSEPLTFVLDGGMGTAWSNQKNNTLSYVLFDGSTHLNTTLTKGYALGGGTSIGSYIDVNKTWRIHPYVKAMRYFTGQQDTTFNVGMEQRIALKRDLALRIDVARNRELQKIDNAISASVQTYF